LWYGDGDVDDTVETGKKWMGMGKNSWGWGGDNVFYCVTLR